MKFYQKVHDDYNAGLINYDTCGVINDIEYKNNELILEYVKTASIYRIINKVKDDYIGNISTIIADYAYTTDNAMDSYNGYFVRYYTYIQICTNAYIRYQKSPYESNIWVCEDIVDSQYIIEHIDSVKNNCDAYIIIEEQMSVLNLVYDY